MGQLDFAWLPVSTAALRLSAGSSFATGVLLPPSQRGIPRYNSRQVESREQPKPLTPLLPGGSWDTASKCWIEIKVLIHTLSYHLNNPTNPLSKPPVSPLQPPEATQLPTTQTFKKDPPRPLDWAMYPKHRKVSQRLQESGIEEYSPNHDVLLSMI